MIALSFILHAIACSTNENPTVNIYGNFAACEHDSSMADINYSVSSSIHIATIGYETDTVLFISSKLRVQESDVERILPTQNVWNSNYERWKITAEKHHTIAYFKKNS